MSKRDYTPTYRVEYRDNIIGTLHQWKQMAWDIRRDGRPTPKNLEQWRVSMNESFSAGSANFHISTGYGILVHVTHTRLIHQATGEIVAQVTVPMFESV